MRFRALVFLAAFGAAFLMGAGGRAPLPDETKLLHNSPPTVEQQPATYGPYCWNDADPSHCVTNTGCADPELIAAGCIPQPGCIWDPDDSLQAAAYDGEWTQCIWADWAGESHAFLVHACRKPERGRWATPLYATVTFSPNGPDRRQVPTQTFRDVFAISRQFECVSGCVRSPQYDRELDAEHFQVVPDQGGGGSVLGTAIYTTVKVMSNGTIGVKMTLAGGASGCEW